MNLNNKETNKDEQLNQVEEYVKELKEQQEIKKTREKEEEISAPEYLLPQFKNIEEQAKSYKELQALQTRQAQELAQYKKAEELNSKKALATKQITDLKKQASLEEAKLKEIFLNEQNNIQLALSAGKITKEEAQKYALQLKNFIQEKLATLNANFENSCSQCGQVLNMASPKEFFKDDLMTRNYLEPICDFLEKNYKTLPKEELEGIKNLVLHLEKTLKDEILNEKKLSQENETYRKNLTSTTNLNTQNNAQKIYTLEEIKKMKPEEFRKNQKAILEQFAAHKIK